MGVAEPSPEALAALEQLKALQTPAITPPAATAAASPSPSPEALAALQNARAGMLYNQIDANPVPRDSMERAGRNYYTAQQAGMGGAPGEGIDPVKNLGASLDFAGELTKGLVQDTAASWMDLPEAHGNMAATFAREPHPFEEYTKEAEGVPWLLKGVSQGVAETLPRIAASALLGPAVPAPVAAGAPFVVNKEGWDPVSGGIMAAFPWVGKLGEKLALATIEKLGLKLGSETGLATLEKLGSYVASEAYIHLTSLPQYIQATPEQRKELFIHNVALNLAFHLPSALGLSQAGVAEWRQNKQVDQALESIAREVVDQYPEGFAVGEKRNLTNAQPIGEGEGAQPTETGTRVGPAVNAGEAEPPPTMSDLSGAQDESGLEPEVSPPASESPEEAGVFPRPDTNIPNTLQPEGPLQQGRGAESLGVPLTREGLMPNSPSAWEIRRRLQERSRSQPSAPEPPEPGPLQRGEGAKSLGVPLERPASTPAEIRARLQWRSRTRATPEPTAEAPNGTGNGQGEAEKAAQESGWTFNEAEQSGGVSLEGLPPELAAKLPRQWEFTDRRSGSPTKGFTIYTPEGMGADQIIKLMELKAGEVKAQGWKQLDRKKNGEALTLTPDPGYDDLKQKPGVTFTDLLTAITERDEDFKGLAAALKARGINPKLVFTDEIVAPEGKPRPDSDGAYDAISHTLYLRNDVHDLAYVALHEGIHAATVFSLQTHEPYRLEVEKMLFVARRAFEKAGIAHGEHYGLTNAMEFVAEAFSNGRFQRELDKIKLDGGESLFDKFVQWVMKIVGLAPSQETLLQRVIQASAPHLKAENLPEHHPQLAAKLAAHPAEEINPQSIIRRPSAASEIFRGKEGERTGSGEEFIKSQQAAEVVASLPVAKEVIGRLKAVAGEVVDKTDPVEVAQKAVAERVLNDPNVRRQLGEPIEGLRSSSRLLSHTLENYYSLKADPNASPEIKSRAALDGLNVLDKWEKSALNFYGSYEGKKKTLEESLTAAIEGKDWHNYTRSTIDVLFGDLKEAGKAMVRQTRDAGALKVYHDMSRRGDAMKNAVSFIANHADFNLLLGVGGMDPVIKTADQLVTHLASLAKEQSPELTMEQAVGASAEVIKYVAQLVVKSEPLRERMLEGQSFLREKALAHPLKSFMGELAKQANEGNYIAALHAYTRGVGRTALEADKAGRAARFFAGQEKTLLEKLAALEEVKKIYDQIQGDRQFQEVRQQVYDDLGVRSIIKGLSQTGFVMKPIFADRPGIVLDFSDSTQAGALKTLAEFKRYKEQAAEYLSDPTAPGYSPAKAAALKDFIRQYDWYANPTINPVAGRLLPSIAMAIPRKVFSLVGGIDQIPNVVLKYGGGFAADYASKTLNALLTAKEVGLAAYFDHQPRLAHALMEALKSHGWDQRHIDLWKESIFYPLASSRQYFENVGVLEAGSPIGNGQEVTRADMGFLKALRDYEKSIIRKLTATDERSKESIKNLPAGIMDKFGQDLRLRLPAETGEDTVNRRMGSITPLAEQWHSLDTQGRIDFLNEHLGRLVFGYLADAPRASFTHRYTYRGEIKEIFHEGRAGDPVTSLADLAQRIVDKWNEHEEREPLRVEEVQAVLLKEFNDLFNRVTKEQELNRLENQKVKIKVFGGEHSLNTERGAQIVPGLWYDYGSVTDPEHVAYLNTSLSKFYVEHLNAIEALHKALTQIVERFEKRQQGTTDNIHRISTKERVEGRDFYSWDEAITAQNQVASYLDKLRSAYAAESEARKTGGRSTLVDTALDVVVSSLLDGPQANIFNSFGGFLNITLHDMTMRNYAWYVGLFRNFGIEGGRAFKELGHLTFHPGNKLAENTPGLGAIFKHIGNYFQATRELYDQGRRDAVVTSKDLGKQVGVAWEWGGTAGHVSDAPADQGRIKSTFKHLEAMVRISTRSLKAGTVMFVDSRINLTAYRLASEMATDLTRRAIKYGELRVRRAEQEGWDPYEAGDINNLFTSRELVGHHWLQLSDLDGRAAGLREFLKREADFNVDARMMDFYRKYAGASEEERANLQLLTPEQMNQLVLAIAGDINLATFGNRPIAARTGKTAQRLSLFLGYPTFQLYKMAGLMNRFSRDPILKGYAKSLPLFVFAVLTAAIVGSLGIGVTEAVKQLTHNKYGDNPTIFDEAGASNLPGTLALGAAATFPFYGSIYNLVSGNSFKRGFDLNSQFVFLNLATDATRMLKEVWQTGSAERPLINFARRWTSPANYLAGFLPQMAGLQELTNTRNILSKTAKSLGMESHLRKQSGAASDNFGPTTPLLNDFANAVGRGDKEGINSSWKSLVDYYVKQGMTPEEAKRRALSGIQSRNPITQVFGTKVTEGELAQLYGRMTPREKAIVSRAVNNFEASVAQVGGHATFTKEAAAASKRKPRTERPARTLAERALTRRSRVGGGGIGRAGLGRVNRKLGIKTPPPTTVGQKKRTRTI